MPKNIVQKFVVVFYEGRQAIKREYDTKGVAFALAKRKSREGSMKPVRVEKYSSVPLKERESKLDKYEFGRRVYRLDKYWEIEPESAQA